MRRPAELYEVDKRAEGAAIDAVMHGAMSEPAQSSDHFFTKQVTKNLFSEAPPHAAGMDLVALNLQRGRDHGLPGWLTNVPWTCRAEADNDLQNKRGLSRCAALCDVSVFKVVATVCCRVQGTMLGANGAVSEVRGHLMT